MKKQWGIIHDCDTEEGQPTLWCMEINHSKYGKYCWISDVGDYYGIEVDYGDGDFVELKQCKSLISAKRWVTMNLL